MKIAIPVTNNDLTSDINSTLGRSPFYLIYDTEIKTSRYVINTAANAQGGAGIKAAQLLLDQDINVLITPRSGTNALEVLHAAKVQIFESVSTNVTENIHLYLEGKLVKIMEGHAGYHHA